jgi:hypothetical protein
MDRNTGVGATVRRPAKGYHLALPISADEAVSNDKAV